MDRRLCGARPPQRATTRLYSVREPRRHHRPHPGAGGVHRALGASALYLFGSGARDELGDHSDIDLFIDRTPEFDYRFTHLIGLETQLKGVLDRPVDVIRTSIELDPAARWSGVSKLSPRLVATSRTRSKPSIQ